MKVPATQERLQTLYRPTGWYFGGFIVLWLLSVSVFGASIPVSRKVMVPGVVVLSGAMQPIVSPRRGIVTDLNVKVGDSVTKELLLLAISPESAAAQDGASSGQMIAAALLQQERADTIDAQAKLLLTQSREDQLRQQIIALEALRQSLTSQRELQRQRGDLARKRLALAAPVAEKGFISQFQIQQWQDNVLQAEIVLSGIDQQIQENAKTERSQRMELAQQVAQRRLIEADGAQRGASLARERAGTVAQSKQFIYASAVGEVAALGARAGDFVQAGEILGIIMPLGAGLQVKLSVPSSAIGLITPERSIFLSFDAFPQAKFGLLRGHILEIATVPLILTDGVAQQQNGSYTVIVSIDRDHFLYEGRRWPVRAGMKVSGAVVLEKRTLIGWIFTPVLAALKGS